MKTKPNLKKLFSILTVVAWMAMIYSFSMQTGQQSGDLSGGVIRWIAGVFNPNFEALSPAEQSEIISAWQFFVRKTAHFSEYAVLGVLTANAVRFFTAKAWLSIVLPAVISAMYAVSDEIHQYFVPERACSIKDMALDTAGAVTGILVFKAFLWAVKKYKNRIKLKSEI